MFDVLRKDPASTRARFLIEESNHNHDRKWLRSTNHLGTKMNHRYTVVLILGVTMCANVAPAYSGPCSSEISKFETAVRQSAGNPNAGPTLPQSVGAQLDHQPTPATMKRAEKQAERMFERTLARAKRLDARGNRAGCTRALAEAKDRYILY